MSVVRTRVWRAGLYLASFGIGRGGIFVGPIILANLLAAQDYGALEVAQAVASIAAVLLSLGTASTVPLVLINGNSSISWSAILLHHVVCAALIVGTACLLLLIGLPHFYSVACIAVGTLLLQSLWSVTGKSLGRREDSLLLDSGFWVLLTLSAVLAWALGLSTASRWNWVVSALCIYFAGLLVWTISRLWASVSGAWDIRYLSTLKHGAPLMLTTLLTILATTSGRLGIGVLASADLAAHYAILFRATALPIVAHQLIVVAAFRRIFDEPIRTLEKRLLIIIGAVTAASALFQASMDRLGFFFGPAFVAAVAEHRNSATLILSQCVLWSSISLNDLINSRALIAKAVARFCILYFAMSLPLAWFFLTQAPLTLSRFVVAHSFVMLGYFLTQVLVMSGCGVVLLKTWSISLAGFVALSSIVILGH